MPTISIVEAPDAGEEKFPVINEKDCSDSIYNFKSGQDFLSDSYWLHISRLEPSFRETDQVDEAKYDVFNVLVISA
jgi:hypothetical protein